MQATLYSSADSFSWHACTHVKDAPSRVMMAAYLGEVADDVAASCVKVAHDVKEEGVCVEVQRLSGVEVSRGEECRGGYDYLVI